MDANVVASVVAAVAAVSAAMVALVALPFTRRAANAARDQTLLQRDIAREARLPLLWADIRPHPEQRSVIALFVGNNGLTTAHDVRVEIEPRVVPGASPMRCVEAQDAAAEGIASLPPGRVIEWYLGLGYDLLSAPGQPEILRVRVSGSASDGTPLRDEFDVRLSDIRTSSAAGYNLEQILQTLKHWRKEDREGTAKLVRELSRLASDADRQD